MERLSMDFSHGRHSNGSSTNSSSSSIGSGGGGREINIAVLGSKGVGKSGRITATFSYDLNISS